MSQIEQVTPINTPENQQLNDEFTRNYIDLASERIGGETLSCSDDFFAEMENLLKSGRGIFIEDKYTERGKWMDGWESRRSFGRTNADGKVHDHDWCVIRLGVTGFIKGFNVDTNFFRGNAPQQISVEACYSEQQPNDNTQWHSVLSPIAVNPHSQNFFRINNEFLHQPFTHVRLNIFPDGGVARFRVYGEVKVNWNNIIEGELIDLAAIKNGGKVLLASDMFFSDKNNLIMPERGKNMGDGWETKRRRDAGNDWAIVKLASQGCIHKVLIDTHHFKGNYPDTCMLEGCFIEDEQEELFTDLNTIKKIHWQPILPKTKLYAHREHLFIKELVHIKEQVFTHVRLSIFPDGGISRMRIFGFRQI